MSPKVYIIILSWNNWPNIRECLESIKNNDYPNYQVVIVDNDSKEKPQPGPEIKIIYNEKNLGFSGGNNVGIKYALENDADYILLLNDDTIVGSQFLTKLVEIGESKKEFGLLGPKIYFYDQKDKIWSAGGKINWLYNKAEMIGVNQIDKGQYNKIKETEYLTACCILVKKEAIQKIGLIPEEYFGYYEDVDWSTKVRRMGYKCIFVPQSKIWHKGSKSFVPDSPSYIYYHVRNGLIFANKFAPWHIKPFVHLDVIWRIGKQIVKLLIPSKRAWVKPILLGIKDFYLGKRGEYENWH